MFPEIARKGIIQRDKFKPYVTVKKQSALIKRLPDVPGIGILRQISFLMRIGCQFFLDSLDAAHPGKFPAGIFDGFITAVAYLLGA